MYFFTRLFTAYPVVFITFMTRSQFLHILELKCLSCGPPVFPIYHVRYIPGKSHSEQRKRITQLREPGLPTGGQNKKRLILSSLIFCQLIIMLICYPPPTAPTRAALCAPSLGRDPGRLGLADTGRTPRRGEDHETPALGARWVTPLPPPLPQ